MTSSGAKLLGLFWLGLAIFLGTSMAFGLPFFAKLIPWSWEKRLAKITAGSFDAEICKSKNNLDAEKNLELLFKRIYPLTTEDASFPLKINVIRGKTVNAFAALGGHIYVYQGLIQQAESPDELAGILAHEIEHVHHRHIIQGLTTRLITTAGLKLIFSNSSQSSAEMANLLLTMKFSREQERQADEEGLKRLQLANVNVAGFEHFFQRTADSSSGPTLLSDHPGHADRAELVKKYRAQASTPIMTLAEWNVLKKICSEK
jgi:Zn-dependent protease with chaperone function